MKEGIGSIDTLRNNLYQKRCELHLLIAGRTPILRPSTRKSRRYPIIQAQIEKLIVRQIIDIRGVLTPEQQELLLDYMGRCMTPPPGPALRAGWARGPAWEGEATAGAEADRIDNNFG